MDFVFICPQTNNLFKTEEFDIIDNLGVQVDAHGNKSLDANVRLTEACPFCGCRHVYHASELSCTFTGSALDRKD